MTNKDDENNKAEVKTQNFPTPTLPDLLPSPLVTLQSQEQKYLLQSTVFIRFRNIVYLL
jgi:hypothetical protein